MTITIIKESDNYILIGAKDKRFREAWGEVNRVSPTGLFTTMEALTVWGNNVLKEEVLFEIS